MARQALAYLAFNRGLVSRLALARADIKRVALSAEVHTNYAPNELGSMTLRPGLGYLTSTKSNNAARCIPFVFSTSDVARVEFTNLIMRVFVSDTPITRVAVSSAVANGDFTTNLTSWTDNDEAGGTSVWVTGGYMGLTGDGTNAAIRDQTVTVAAADQNVEHALRILINRGPVVLRVGTGTTDDSYIRETTLDTGEYSLAFTPTGDFNIRFQSLIKRQVLVNSCNVEAAGVMEITSAYTTADLDNIVAGPDSQSGDIIYIACDGYQQTKIERRATRSWGLCKYYADDGPFRVPNTGPITLTAAALSGNTTLTASKALFLSTQVGVIYRLTSSGQTVTASITAQNTFTNAIEVDGVDAQRVFTLTITGLTGTGSTVTLQRSLESSTGSWTDYASYTADQSTTIDDALDNQNIWYRIGVKTGNYVAGTIVPTLTYQAGTTDGVARITGFTSSTVVSVEVITDFGGTAATSDWAEGEWSDRRGWPTSVCFYEGRLSWQGKNGIWESVSDAFTSFDPNVEGDSGPISRTVGAGPVDKINWALPLQRLILGAEGAEFSARASSFDEILTPSNFNLKSASTQGSAPVQAVKVDSRGVYVQRGGTRVYELSFDAETYDYGSTQLSALIPEIGQPGIVRMAVQRQPNTRIHFIRSDGTAACVVYNKTENLICWWEIETDGDIEDVSVLPGASGSEEDQVYYVVARTINGATVRYHEKWAKESECIGETTNKQADAFVTFSQAASTTITGLSHLIGESVVVWQDGICQLDASDDPQTFTVSGAGEVTGLTTAAAVGMVGLPYTAQWQSAKLNQLQVQLGTPLVQHKKLNGLGLVLANTHCRGLKVGQDFTHLRGMPTTEGGKAVPANTIWTDYDEPTFAVNGSWDTDARMCLESQAPLPCTVVCAVVDATVNE